MLTAHKVKLIKSLDKKKFRQKYNLFAVEGNKIIRELQDSPYIIHELYSTAPDDLQTNALQITQITDAELKKISFLQHPKDSLALCRIRPARNLKESSRQLVLDGIQDPGNLGTLIRLADWFGIENIICSEDTVDVYNPKVIQASMGSFVRVNLYYCNLKEFLDRTENISIATDMDGSNIYRYSFPSNLNLILGNEGNGIRTELFEKIKEVVTVPRFGQIQSTESLNVAVAAAIVLGQIFAK